MARPSRSLVYCGGPIVAYPYVTYRHRLVYLLRRRYDPIRLVSLVLQRKVQFTDYA